MLLGGQLRLALQRLPPFQGAHEQFIAPLPLQPDKQVALGSRGNIAASAGNGGEVGSARRRRNAAQTSQQPGAEGNHLLAAGHRRNGQGAARAGIAAPR